jgi:alkylation response protein AidB-like acyl-CoA dehydrogenase
MDISFFSSPLFTKKYSSLSEYRELTFQRLKYICDNKMQSVLNSPNDFINFSTLLHYYDPSLAVKCNVHFGLFGNSIINLGTKKHIDEFLPKIDSLEVSGIFAMTELAHGSNVRDLQTTATYFPNNRTFIINTPNDNAQKYWIGNAAQHGTHAIVFANLILNDKKYGIHAFVVQIRKNGIIMPNISIKDCGYKAGLDGVDNGRIWFDNIIVPYDALLDKFAQINENNEYTSVIKNNDQRFAKSLATLSGGRIVVADGALAMAKYCWTIAFLYSSNRRQFKIKESDFEENKLINYQLHQFKLIPIMAKLFCFNQSLLYLKSLKSIDEECHPLSCAFKAIISWESLKSIQICREACGGHGYELRNLIGNFRNDCDIFCTFEGDNTVLLLQVLKYLVSKTIKKTFFEQIQFYLDTKVIPSIKLERLNKIEYLKYLFIIKYKIQIFNYLQSMKNNKQNWNHFMIDAIEITKSWTYYRILKDAPNEHELTHLFALITLYENGSWYLENNMITTDGMKYIFENIKNRISNIAKKYENKNIFDIPEVFLDRIPMLNQKLYSKL